MTPRDYALLAQEAYTAAPDIGIADSASRAIVRQTAAGLCVAFPGTNNVDSVGADLDVMPIEVPGIGMVHRGFWEAWQAIAVPVLAAIGGRPVTLAGHSLGAAIAIMAAASMTVGGNAPAAVYGFEPPRVSPCGNVATLLARVPLSLYRNGNDIVPDLPLDWEHAGALTQIGKPSFPFPNVTDHAISRVIAALAA
ncbi:lipase family protein [Burkholderia sp. PU8-34]